MWLGYFYFKSCVLKELYSHALITVSRNVMPSLDNKCGTCTMCCKILFVNELKKPKNTWCEHCAIGTGCKVYQDRPASCAGFKCLWLQSQEGFQKLPFKLRPDKCKVVLHQSADEKNVVARVDPNYPNAWREKDIGLMLGKLTERYFVLVDNGREYWMLKDGQARQARMSPVDEDGNETFLDYV